MSMKTFAKSPPPVLATKHKDKHDKIPTEELRSLWGLKRDSRCSKMINVWK